MSYFFKIAENTDEIKLSQLFRSKIFRNSDIFCDTDELDKKCIHFLIFDKLNSNKLVCVFRVYIMLNFNQIKNSYSHQFYKLNNLKKIKEPMLELGRFCIDPKYKDPKIIMTAWFAIRNLVEKNHIKFLFGCSSFFGTSIEKYSDCFKFLKSKYIAPKNLVPYVKAPKVFKFNKLVNLNNFCLKKVRNTLPPLLSSYLKLGGWVSDHVVIDHDLQTMHVFTGLEIKDIPDKRLRFLKSFNFH